MRKIKIEIKEEATNNLGSGFGLSLVCLKREEMKKKTSR